jgi:hypothetical protein
MAGTPWSSTNPRWRVLRVVPTAAHKSKIENGITATRPEIFFRFARDFLTNARALNQRAIEDRTEEGVKHCVFYLPTLMRGNSRE